MFPRLHKTFGESHSRAVRFALILQTVLVVMSALVLDGGQTLRTFCVAMLCQWAVSLIILLRRPHNPTSVDLWVLRYGVLVFLFFILGVLELRK